MVWVATTGLLLLLANKHSTASARRPAGKYRAGGAFLQVTVDECGQLRLGNRADLGGLDLAVFEQHQGRDATDTVLGRGLGVLVDIELGDLELGAVFAGNFLKHRTDHLAGPG